MARNRGSDLHDQILEMLLEKVRDDRFPSPTMLDMVEGLLQDDDVELYASVLLDKVRQDAYPSIDHLRRLQAFA
jgi:hypothetical protein